PLYNSLYAMKHRVFGFWFDGPGLIIAAPVMLLLWGTVTTVIALGIAPLIATDAFRRRRMQPR
ncbi:MAG: hypothetical protein DRI40_08115, partial [Chloroflexi bacterium]